MDIREPACQSSNRFATARVQWTESGLYDGNSGGGSGWTPLTAENGLEVVVRLLTLAQRSARMSGGRGGPRVQSTGFFRPWRGQHRTNSIAQSRHRRPDLGQMPAFGRRICQINRSRMRKAATFASGPVSPTGLHTARASTFAFTAARSVARVFGEKLAMQAKQRAR